MTDDERRELLAQSRDCLAEMSWGLAAFVARKREQMGGYPAGGSGSSAVAYSQPVERQLREEGHKPECNERDICNCAARLVTAHDKAAHELNDFDKALRRINRDVRKVWTAYKDNVAPTQAPARMADPGCEMCAEVENHWCASFMETEVVVEVPAKAKSRKQARKPRTVAQLRKLRLCEWCYRFSRPYRHGRLPSLEELHTHASGKRVRVKAG